MTMADTIAVMNAGRIEQLGAPTDLYDSPATVFVANFLGQSNLVAARVDGRSGGDVVVDVHGRTVVVPQQRSRATSTQVYVGVRPEKLTLVTSGRPPAEAGWNALDATVVDSSFIGVSTQYLVRTAWDQELVVFAQNDGSAPQVRPGDPVELRWQPQHGFCLDASTDIDAGVVLDEGAAEPDPVEAHA